MGWALQNLNKQSREAIAHELFKVTETSGDWINGKCPLHDDSNPSFGYNVAEDVFHCHTLCVKDGDLIDLFCLINGFDQQAGFIKFRNRYDDAPRVDHKTGPGRPAPTPKPKKPGKKKADGPAVDIDQMAATFESFPPLPEKWIERLAEIRGWTKQAIEALDIRYQVKYRDKQTGNIRPVSDRFERIAIPIRDKNGILQNIRLYKPSAKENKIISWGKGVGSNRLYPWPETSDQEAFVWICEGEADTICARSHGLEAYTQTAKRKVWPKDQVAPFAGRDVVIAYDADRAGKNYSRAAAVSLSDVARSVRIINWPTFMMDEDGKLPKDHGQDLTDFFVKHKKVDDDLINLLAEADEIKSLPFEGDVGRFFDITRGGRESFVPRLLADQLREDVDLLYDPETGKLFRWNQLCFEIYGEDSLKKRAIEYLGREAMASRYNDAVNQAILLSTRPEGRFLDDYGSMLCLQNGMFNTDTYELVPHDKKYLATIQLDLEFDPDNPQDCPRWKQFLRETVQTDEVIEQVQEFFGLCLTQDKRYEKCLIMIGDGGDGKSTSQAVLKNLVGKQNCSAIGMDALQDQFQRVMLHKKMVNLSSEVSGKPMDAEYFKKIISGDETSASYKHKDGFNFEPFCKLVFALNKMPKIIDTTDGLYRRILPVHFKRQFKTGDPDKDPFLIDKLMAELPGIFGWAIDGLGRLRKRGDFNVDVPETQELIHGYRRGNNPVYAFVEDCLEFTGDDVDEIPKVVIYEKYKSYCGKFGYGATHYNNMFIDLRLAIKAYKDSTPRRGGERVAIVHKIRLKENLDLS